MGAAGRAGRSARDRGGAAARQDAAHAAPNGCGPPPAPRRARWRSGAGPGFLDGANVRGRRQGRQGSGNRGMPRRAQSAWSPSRRLQQGGRRVGQPGPGARGADGARAPPQPHRRPLQPDRALAGPAEGRAGRGNPRRGDRPLPCGRALPRRRYELGTAAGALSCDAERFHAEGTCASSNRLQQLARAGSGEGDVPARVSHPWFGRGSPCPRGGGRRGPGHGGAWRRGRCRGGVHSRQRPGPPAVGWTPFLTTHCPRFSGWTGESACCAGRGLTPRARAADAALAAGPSEQADHAMGARSRCWLVRRSGTPQRSCMPQDRGLRPAPTYAARRRSLDTVFLAGARNLA